MNAHADRSEMVKRVLDALMEARACAVGETEADDLLSDAERRLIGGVGMRLRGRLGQTSEHGDLIELGNSVIRSAAAEIADEAGKAGAA